MVVLLAVGAAACGGSDDSAATETSANGTLPSTAAPQSTETPAEENGSVAATTAAPTGVDGAVAPDAPSLDGPPAPNFELALVDGSSFVLSDEQKPVYLIFWAEW